MLRRTLFGLIPLPFIPIKNNNNNLSKHASYAWEAIVEQFKITAKVWQANDMDFSITQYSDATELSLSDQSGKEFYSVTYFYKINGYETDILFKKFEQLKQKGSTA